MDKNSRWGRHYHGSTYGLLKAFDTVPHRRLLCKLQYNGINGKLLGCITNSLMGHSRKVKVSECSSSWGPLTSGILQGSVLGPILFVIYINDLPCNTSSAVYIFPDDVHDVETLQSDLYKLDQWSMNDYSSSTRINVKYWQLGLLLDFWIMHYIYIVMMRNTKHLRIWKRHRGYHT